MCQQEKRFNFFFFLKGIPNKKFIEMLFILENGPEQHQKAY